MLSITSASALDIVYPKQKNVTINSPSTFFIGSAQTNKNLYINNESVNIHFSGGFAKVVPLKVGENTFTVKSGNEILTYKITRRATANTISGSNKVLDYNQPKFGTIKNDNTPLRSTPIDFGINRLSHLPIGTELVINGEQNGFYKVTLGNKIGYIGKNSVQITDNIIYNAELLGINYKDNKDYYIYSFDLNKKVPFELEENNGLKIHIYNIKGLKHNTFSMEFPSQTMLYGKNLVGYSAEYEGNNLIVKIRKPLNINLKHPLKGITIAIDAGHGGKEYGAIGCLGIKEKDLNLLYAKALETELSSRGANIIMTRNDDSYIGLYERSQIANDENSVVFISIHGNALPDNLDPTKNHGTEIYYFYNQAEPIAKSIMNEIKKIPQAHDHGIIQQSFAVVRNTKALSLLIEVGYLINPADNYLITSEDFRKKTVDAIADGLEKYFLSQK